MRNIRISDLSLCMSREKASLTFREKIELARYLDRLHLDMIELGGLSEETADSLLIKSIASAVTETKLAVCIDPDDQSVKRVWNTLSETVSPRLQIRAAVSTARMEYVYHKKADKLLGAVTDSVKEAARLCEDVEFIAEDATRADFDYLCSVLCAAIDAGAQTVTVCDTAGIILPYEFGAFIKHLYESIPPLKKVTLGVCCSDNLGVADACAVAAVQEGAGEIKVSALPGDGVSLERMARIFTAKSDIIQASCSVRTTELQRVLQSMERLCRKEESGRSPFDNGVREYPEHFAFSADSTPEEIAHGAEMLGFDLSEEDQSRIWKAFREAVQRKDSVSMNELEAIIASEAMQVPAAYTLLNFVVTTGNAIDILAHVKLKKGEEIFDGLSVGDGPIDAAFLAIEKITGHHYELDDFQIQAITEGREAMGQTIVKLRSGGKVYSGRGISTDIIGSGVAAYVSALNKILYEEEHT